MATKTKKPPVELLQGTLDLIVLRALWTMGPQHSYGLAARLEQVADHPLMLNQGTLYPALVRLEQKRLDQGQLAADGDPPRRQVLRDYRSGTRALAQQTERWRRLSSLVDKLINEG